MKNILQKIKDFLVLKRIYIYSIRMIAKNRTYVCISSLKQSDLIDAEILIGSPIGKELKTFDLDQFEIKVERIFYTNNKKSIMKSFDKKVKKYQSVRTGYNKIK